MNVHYLFLEPIDVLFFRNNKGFGDPGSYGESMVPPWPSVVAGALRSRILADAGIDPAAFAAGSCPHPELGSPEQPGSFRLTCLQLARRSREGVEALYPTPADVVPDERGVHLARPVSLAGELRSSYPLPLHPVLAQDRRSKPQDGLWMTAGGWQKYLRGQTPSRCDFISSAELWQTDPRIGIGLNPHTRSVDEGRLFTAEAAAFRLRFHGKASEDTGLLAAVTGCTPPDSGPVRLGADGRAAVLHPVAGFRPPEPDWERIVGERRLRLVLASPGLFCRGWISCDVQEQDGQLWLDLHGVRGKLVCAAVARAEVVSGWDLARQRPKTAKRCAAAGSVYWLDEVQAEVAALQALVGEGLWPDPCPDPFRRAEGFNRVWVAPWAGDNEGD